MASTAQHIEARADQDLMARLAASAEMQGVPSAMGWVQSHIGELLIVPVDGSQTIVDMHAYASDVRKQAVAALPPEPGINPGAVTDAHLSTAIESVLTAQ